VNNLEKRDVRSHNKVR